MRHIHHDFLCGLITEEQFWDVFQRLTHIRLPQTEKLYTKYFIPGKNTTTLALIQRLREKKHTRRWRLKRGTAAPSMARRTQGLRYIRCCLYIGYDAFCKTGSDIFY